MATFLTITQNGFNFNVHEADKLKADEEWGIERVAAFMSVHHVLSTMATKYMKGMTLRPAVASIMYTLNCDAVTSRDLDKLTGYLVPKLCDIYTSDGWGFLGGALSKVLDDVEKLALDHIASEEEPIEILGKTCTPPKFLSRPSKLEYDAIIAKDKAAEQALWDRFKEVLNSGKAAGHHIQMREGPNVYTCVIIKVSPKCIYCDVKDEYGRLLQSGARFPRDSKRFIIASFR